jgi:hypothetical protein
VMRSLDREKLESLLREACLLTQASWAVWADRASGTWQIIAAHGIRGPLLVRVTAHIQQSTVDSWMCGAFSSNALRSRTFPIEGAISEARDAPPCSRHFFSHPGCWRTRKRGATIVALAGRNALDAPRRDPGDETFLCFRKDCSAICPMRLRSCLRNC